MNNLIILAGWTRDKRSYIKLIDSAPSNWQVFVPSYKELEPYKGMPVFKQNLLKYLERHKLSTVNFLGHSLGGALGLYFVASHQNKIKRLFLVDSKGLHDKESFFIEIWNFLKEHSRKSLTQNVCDLFRALKNPILNLQLLFLAHYLNATKEAKQVRQDTTILWGEKDFIAPISHGKKLKSLIPNSKLYILKDMGHDWILNSPEHFWNKV